MIFVTACDEELVKLAKCGQQSAYTELCRRYSQRIFAMALRITRNHEDAEDVLQTSLMKAFVGLSKFDGRSAFSTWLTSIGINSALMLLRKRRCKPELSIDDLDESGNSLVRELVEAGIGPEEIVIQSEINAYVNHAISRLPPRLKSVITLRQSHDASLEEIANELGISLQATKSRLMRARARLRSSLGWRQRRRQSFSWKRQYYAPEVLAISTSAFSEVQEWAMVPIQLASSVEASRVAKVHSTVNNETLLRPEAGSQGQ